MHHAYCMLRMQVMVLHACRCNRCGRDTELQVQLMAPLISIFAEAGEWLAQCRSADEACHAEAPISWDWVTVAVFACTGCGRDAHGSLHEAVVLVANEEN